MGVKIGINGAGGRMGRRLIALTCADPELELAEAVEREGSSLSGKPVTDLEPLSGSAGTIKTLFTANVEAIIDFSTPKATLAVIEQACSQKTALVIGTTGFEPEQAESIKKASLQIPIVWAPNMSLGVNILFRTAKEVAKALGQNFDIEIVEAHHNQKEDAPSGTAMELAKQVAAALERNLESDLVHGRSGRPGARKQSEIGMHSLRMGSIVGEHTVHFCNEFEQISLSHSAKNRDVFASGALRAAKWVVKQKPGLYDMQNVLFD